jgi:profilin
MSWQDYVDEICKVCTAGGAILGHDGRLWAGKAGFSLKADEPNRIVDALLTDPFQVTRQGIWIGGVKYLALKADENSIYGGRTAGGCVIVKTKKTILIGVYDESTAPGEATRAVERMGERLREVEF